MDLTSFLVRKKLPIFIELIVCAFQVFVLVVGVDAEVGVRHMLIKGRGGTGKINEKQKSE